MAYRYSFNRGVTKIKTKTMLLISALSLAVAGGGGLSLAILGTAHAATPTWNLNGTYTLDFELGGSYVHDATISGQDNSGNFVVGGGYPAGGAYTFAWNGTGNVTGNSVTTSVDYSVGAVGTHMDMTGTIASDGSMSGTWTDNYGGGTRNGTWSTATGHAALSVAGCNFDVSVPGTWTLLADCTTTEEINVPTSTTLDGANHTISAGFVKTDNSNNAVLGVINDANVTVKNLTINGTGGTNLHGIVAYVSTNMNVNHVTINNINRIGINVNGSDVTVSNVKTSNSGWEGIDVDSGSGVTQQSVLNVNGPMDQFNDARDIYVDSTSKVPASVVNDTLGQYTYQNNVFVAGDRLYTELAVAPSTKDQCMNNGWKNFQAKFKNQGDCVSFVATNGKNQPGL
jgi:hypothetical protein